MCPGQNGRNACDCTNCLWNTWTAATCECLTPVFYYERSHTLHDILGLSLASLSGQLAHNNATGVALKQSTPSSGKSSDSSKSVAA